MKSQAPKLLKIQKESRKKQNQECLLLAIVSNFAAICFQRAQWETGRLFAYKLLCCSFNGILYLERVICFEELDLIPAHPWLFAPIPHQEICILRMQSRWKTQQKVQQVNLTSFYRIAFGSYYSLGLCIRSPVLSPDFFLYQE